MKPQATLRSFLLLAGSSLFAISDTQAATLYWDGDTPAGPPGGGAGTWQTAGNWDTSPNTDSSSNWTDGNTAYFGGAAGTVTIDTGGVTVDGLSFSTTAYTLAAGANGLNFGSGTNTILLNNAAAATITGTVGGTGDVVLTRNTNGGTLTLSTASGNGWSGTTTVSSGTTLSLASTSNALIDSTGISINGGTITVNKSGVQTEQVSDTAGMTFNGSGTYQQTNGSSGPFAETIGPVTVASGQASFNYTNGASSGGVVTTLTSLSRSVNTTAVTFSNANAAQTSFRVSGAADTAADEIIGPWTTFGTSVAVQTDYAIHTGANGTVAARDTAASAESTWSTTHALTSNFTLANASGSAVNGRLTATRNINSLRNTTASTAVTANNTTDVINLTGHGFVAGDVVALGGTTAPTGLTAGVPYYVINPTANDFQLSTTSGGGASLFSTNGTTVNITGGITLPSGFNFGSTGILNGSGATLAIGGDGGTITLPTTTAGELFVTAGTGPIAIAAPITDNTGALTLVKNGNNALTLTGNHTFTGGLVNNAGGTTLSGTNTFGSGAVTINGGAVTFSTVNSWGGTGRNVTFNGGGSLTSTADGYTTGGTLTVNAGAYATVGGGNTTFTTTTGTGTLVLNAVTANKIWNLGNAGGFTGTLQARMSVNTTSPNGGIQFSSLGDGAGSALQFVNAQGGNNDSGLDLAVILSGDAGPLTFNNRQVQILDRINGNWEINENILANNNTTAANNWVINTDLLNLGGRANSNPQTSRFLTLSGSNTGDNAFNGKISDGVVAGTAFNVQKSGNGTWKLTGDNTYTGSTTVSAGILDVDDLANGGSSSSIGASDNAAGKLVITGGARLRYSGAGATTDRGFTLNTTSTTNSGIIDASGEGALVLSNTATPAYGNTNQARALVMSGSNTDANTLAATLTNNGSSAFNFRKLSPGRWVLTGTNIYSGTTAIEGGVLQAIDGTGLPTDSILQLRGGVFQSSGTFSRAVSTAAGAVNWSSSSGGFAAIGGTLTLNLDGGTGSLTWNGSSMVSTGQELIFGSTTADSLVDWQNDINLGSSGSNTRTVTVVDNPGSMTDIARISGDLTNTLAGQGLLKNGDGTLELTGANTYTGLTTVAAGTLALVGGSQESDIEVDTGASLGFSLGSPTISTADVDLTDGTVKITGTVDNVSSYQLMTAASFTGPLTLSPAIPNYTLELQGVGDTELWLVPTGPVTDPFLEWSGAADFNVDSNNDGIDNGMAWLLGADNKNVNALGLLPEIDTTTDPAYFIFTYRRADSANDDTPNTTITAEYSTTLAGWTTAVDDVGDDIDIIVTDDHYALSPDGVDRVVVKLKRSTLAPGGKLFARLKVVQP